MFEAGHPEALEVMAMAAAFAPDAARPPFYGDLPYREEGGKVVLAEPAYARWVAHLPMARLDREAAGLATLRGLRIPHEFFADDGGHMDFARFRRDAVPFFARALAGAAPRPR